MHILINFLRQFHSCATSQSPCDFFIFSFGGNFRLIRLQNLANSSVYAVRFISLHLWDTSISNTWHFQNVSQKLYSTIATESGKKNMVEHLSWKFSYDMKKDCSSAWALCACFAGWSYFKQVTIVKDVFGEMKCFEMWGLFTSLWLCQMHLIFFLKS